MLSVFRRFAASPIGLVIFGLILIAFVVTLYEGKSGLGGITGTSVATVGGEGIPDAEAVRRIQERLDEARQREATIDMNAFVAQGGADLTIDQLVDARAIDIFAVRQGMVASRKLIDGEIASIPAFNGPTGTFDRATFQALLAQRKTSEAQLRDDLRRSILSKALLIPISGGVRVGATFAEPYAALLLEGRTGEIAELPSAKFTPAAAPSDADLNQFYQRNIARYTIPERRVLRYATFDTSMVSAKAAATDAEIEAKYKADADRYGAHEKRSFSQLIVPVEAQANDLAAKIRAGMSIEAAAKTLQRDVLKVEPLDRAAFEKQTSANVADAAFSAKKGELAAVKRSGLGFHVIHVDAINIVAATPLSAVRAQIATELASAKVDRLLAEYVAKIEDQASNNATFDEIVKANGLTPAVTPAIASTGAAADAPDYKLPIVLTPALSEAFQAEPGDDPAVVASQDRKSFALWKLDRVVPPAPQPLASIRDKVIADARLDAGSKAAKAAADAAVAAVNAGTPLAQALAKTGAALPAVTPIKATRLQLAQAREKVPPPMAMMFTMQQGKARALQMPGREGWYIVHLSSVVPGDVRTQPGLVKAAQNDIAGILSDEYVQQFARAIRTEVGASKDPAAIARLKQSLTNGGAAR